MIGCSPCIFVSTSDFIHYFVFPNFLPFLTVQFRSVQFSSVPFGGGTKILYGRVIFKL